ncbi:TadE/TadG family type IV pilus assembly protein [Streptomyces sp. RKAG337]|uniref:TadE/TadG family type IV pilus assembly protein n=1 Tax=Streptomyces sp. RKAG337 TaxID=2893404 RepID=UPI0027E3DFCB|nr:pilus assembly protein TadG-related protein [Streptomyces sp. RKAG337]
MTRTTPNPSFAPLRDDRGSLSMWWLLMIIPLFVMLGLCFDLGGKLRDVERADGLAAEAARAGGQAIDPGKAISGSGVVLDPAAAQRAAYQYLNAAGVRGTVTVAADGKTINVHVTIQHKTIFLQVIGQSSLPVEGHASAELLHGIGAPEG